MTAIEVSTIAVLYALINGETHYGGISLKKLYGMAVETAALSGAILIILGCVFEGLPAIVPMAPIMFPIAKALAIIDVIIRWWW